MYRNNGEEKVKLQQGMEKRENLMNADGGGLLKDFLMEKKEIC